MENDCVDSYNSKLDLEDVDLTTSIDKDSKSLDFELKTDFELSLDEEVYLKKLLIKVILEKELELCGVQPNVKTLDSDTVLLRHLYNRLIIEFPPFKRRKDFTAEKLNDLLVSV